MKKNLYGITNFLFLLSGYVFAVSLPQGPAEAQEESGNKKFWDDFDREREEAKKLNVFAQIAPELPVIARWRKPHLRLSRC